MAILNPEPSLAAVAPNQIVNLSDAPGALDDTTFDSLFPAEPTLGNSAAPAAEPTPAPASNQEPNPQPTTTEPFIRASKSVYNSPEAAVEGINQKDALIEQLRQRYALTTGIDPITGQPVANLQQPQPQGIDYNTSPDKYMEDLYSAFKSGGPQAYRDVQQKFILDTLKPLQPTMQRAAREQALEAVSRDIKEAPNFVGTPQYDQTLDAIPELKEAIRTAESDYRFHSRLPGLYKIAYLSGQGRQLPELLKANAQKPATQNQPTQQRTTAVPTTPNLPAPSASRPSFKTIDGIKATIAEAEARGAKLDF
jgi:hypothetical protein